MDETSKTFIKWEKFLGKILLVQKQTQIFVHNFWLTKKSLKRKVNNILQCYHTETIDKVNDFFYI